MKAEMLVWDEASEVPRETWGRLIPVSVVTPTLYRMLEKSGDDMRFYKINEPIDSSSA